MAGEVTGQSKRAELVRMKLKPGAGLVKQKQSPLERESHKGLYPFVEKFIKYDLLNNCESKFHTSILPAKKANRKIQENQLGP